MGRRCRFVSTDGTIEALEARVVLSMAYYESTLIRDFAGFPGGPQGEIAGMSDNAEYLWSAGARWGVEDNSPAFLVIDGVYRGWEEFPQLAGSRVLDINSRGTAVGTDVNDERLFLLDLVAGGERVYLESLITDAPAGFDLGGASALELGDGGILVLSDNTTVPGQPGTAWGLLDGVVTELWASELAIRHVLVEPDNAVLGQRCLVYDTDGLGHDRFDVVRWTPDESLTVVDGLLDIYAMNSGGHIVGRTSAGDGILTAAGEFLVVNFRGQTPIGIGGDGEVLVYVYYSLNHGYTEEAQLYDGGVLTTMEDRGGSFGLPVGITNDGIIVLTSGVNRRLSPDKLIHSLGGQASVVIDADGRVITSYVNLRGGIGSIVSQSGEIDYGEVARVYALEGDTTVQGITEPLSGGAQLLYRGSLLHEFEEAQHRFVNFTHTNNRAPDPVAFSNRLGRIVLAGYAEDGHVWVDYQRLFKTWYWQDWVWTSDDLSRNHLDKRGLETPAFQSALAGFTTPWGAMNIVGLDADGDLHAVWWSPGLRSSLWTTTNLSEVTGAPKLVGNITASATKWNGMQVFGTDERGHAIVVWWAPGPLGWRWNDLTEEAAGEPLVPGSITGATTRWNAIELVGRTADDQVATYWWAPGQKTWTYESITLQQSGSTPRITGPVSLALGPDGSQHIAGVSAAGEVIHLFWLPDAQDLWRGENLTELAAG
jgi:hypothetical protein